MAIEMPALFARGAQRRQMFAGEAEGRQSEIESAGKQENERGDSIPVCEIIYKHFNTATLILLEPLVRSPDWFHELAADCIHHTRRQLHAKSAPTGREHIGGIPPVENPAFLGLSHFVWIFLISLGTEIFCSILEGGLLSTCIRPQRCR